MRVALKSIKGVDTVDVSLEKGQAVVTFAPGNTVRYDDLLRAVEKNGFVVKGSTIVADGHVSAAGPTPELTVSGSNDHFRLEAASSSVIQISKADSKAVEITGSIPEAAKGKTPDVLRYDSVIAK